MVTPGARAGSGAGWDIAATFVTHQDPERDIAVLQVFGAGASALPMGDATTLVRGDVVYAMGTPAGLDFTFSEGIVSHPERHRRGLPYLQIDAGIAPGSSGGPVLDQFGNAVGMVCATDTLFADPDKRENPQAVVRVCVPAESIMRLIQAPGVQ